MPYIRIKAYPKDQATKEKVVEAINKTFVMAMLLGLTLSMWFGTRMQVC